MDEADLIKINERIGAAEQAGDAEFLREVLADELVFRKASGRIVSKEQFLAELADNKFERESSDLKVTLDEQVGLAMVVLTVRASGGEFRNLRVFERRAGGWQCLFWFNTKRS